MVVHLGPTGKLVKGHVLDVNVRSFTEKLQDYDSLLYVSWNPRKRRKWGCWEIRRLPEKKTFILKSESPKIYELEYVENNLIHHVLDCEFLNYDAIRKIKEMDTWEQEGDWVSNHEYKRLKYREEQDRKQKEEMRYNMRQHKRELREFKEEVASGVNPMDFFWGQYGKRRK